MKQQNLTKLKSTVHTIASILSWTALVILIAIAAFLLYVGVSTKLYSSKGSAYEPKFSLYTIISPSMVPNLNVYDTIIDKKVDDPSTIEIGDVITFISTSTVSNGKTVTHRVIDIIHNEDGTLSFKTKGDNNMTPDSAYAESSKILGRVIFKIPQLGRIQFLLAKRGAWILLILIPSVIVLIRYIIRLIKLLTVEEKLSTSMENLEKSKKNKNIYK